MAVSEKDTGSLPLKTRLFNFSSGSYSSDSECDSATSEPSWLSKRLSSKKIGETAYTRLIDCCLELRDYVCNHGDTRNTCKERSIWPCKHHYRHLNNFVTSTTENLDNVALLQATYPACCFEDSLMHNRCDDFLDMNVPSMLDGDTCIYCLFDGSNYLSTSEMCDRDQFVWMKYAVDIAQVGMLERRNGVEMMRRQLGRGRYFIDDLYRIYQHAHN